MAAAVRRPASVGTVAAMSTDLTRRRARARSGDGAGAVVTTSRRTAWLVVVGALLVATIAVLSQRGPWPSAGGTGPADPDRAVVVGRGDADSARLTITGEADSVRIVTDAPAEALLRVEPTGADRVVAVDEDGEQPVVALGGGAVEVRLAPDARWTLDLQVGAGSIVADVADVPVDGVAVAAGAQTVELRLPRPTATVRVDQRAGVGTLLLGVPDGVGVRAVVTSGAGSATVDGETTGGLGAGAEVTTEGFDPDADHYEVVVAGGAGSLVIERD